MAPRSDQKPVVEKAEKKIKPDTKRGATKKRTKKNVESYKIYIHKVLKQVHPNIGISRETMEIMNEFMNDMFEKLAQEAARSVRYNKKLTITPREIRMAVQLILPEELAKRAVFDATKAVRNFNTYTSV